MRWIFCRDSGKTLTTEATEDHRESNFGFRRNKLVLGKNKSSRSFSVSLCGYFLTSKLIVAPAVTRCPAEGYCRRTKPASDIPEELFASPPLTVWIFPNVNPAFSTAVLASVTDRPTKLGITYCWPLSAAAKINPTLGEVTSVASAGGLCATTVPAAAPGK